MADLTPETVPTGTTGLTVTDPTGSITILQAAPRNSGTGGYNTFLAVHDSGNDGFEAGFNSDNSTTADLLENDGSKTNAVKLSSLPVTTIGGIDYYIIRLDLNESNGGTAPQIYLNQLRIYTGKYDIDPAAAVNLIDTYAELNNPANATLRYNLDGTDNHTILLRDNNSGSGTDDYEIRIPVSTLGDASVANDYLYLSVQFGSATKAFEADGGFEEFNAQNAVALSGTKFIDDGAGTGGIAGDGIRQAGEIGQANVTIFIDNDKDGVLDAGERTAVTDSLGNYTFGGVIAGTYQIDEVVPTGFRQSTGDFETVVVPSNFTPGATITVDPIGNKPLVADFSVSKVATSIAGGVGANGLGGANSAGDVVNYTITVTNTGDVALTGFTISDPNATTLSAVSGDTGNDGVLSLGEVWTVTATHTVTQPELDSPGTSGTGGLDTDSDTDNTVTVDFAQTAPRSATATTPLLPAPSIAITKVFTGWTGGNGNSVGDAAGDVANYSIVVMNTGNVTLTNVVVTDPLTNATYNVGVLAPGASSMPLLEQYTITQTDLDTRGDSAFGNIGPDGDIDNTATATSNQTGPASASATAPLVYAPDFTVTKSAAAADGTADKAGETINFSAVVKNTGNISLTGVSVSDAVEGVLGSAAVTSFSGDTNGDTVLDVGETWTYTGSYALSQAQLDSKGVNGDGLLTDTITATTTEAGSKTATADVPLTYAPDFTVTKSAAAADGTADKAGETINFSAVVKNTGNISLTGVSVSDAVEGVLGSAAVTSFSGDTNGDTVLDVGETWTYTGSYALSQAQLDSKGVNGDGLLTDTITATTTEAGSKTATADVPLTYAPDFTVTKSAAAADGTADTAGETINFSAVVKNTGNISLTGVSVSDAVEGVLGSAAVTSFSGDTNGDTVLDVGETWTYTGSYALSQAQLDSKGVNGDGLLTDTITATTTEAGSKMATADVPLTYAPDFTVTKSAAAADGTADKAGETINFSAVVKNTGNISLTGVSVSDAVEGVLGSAAVTSFSGDTNGDTVLDVGETWTYTGSYALSQAQLDSKGVNGDGLLTDTITATTTEAGSKTATADVPLTYAPSVDIEKLVSVTGKTGTYIDADSTDVTPQNLAIGQPVWFHVELTNKGNVTLDTITIVDTNSSSTTTSSFKLVDNGVLAAGATVTGDTGNDGILGVGEKWTIEYTQPFDTGKHINTAVVSTGQGVTDTDDATYFSVVNTGPGVRTPGFWSNLGAQFWDGNVGNESKVGPTFAKGELTYAVDSNNDGFINVKAGDGINDDKALDGTGLLVGDYNKNGLTDADEDTLFISLADAKQLINASLKTQAGDGVQTLGRDVVATWLNFLAKNSIDNPGTADDSYSPKHFIDDAVNWLQTFGDKDNSAATGNTFNGLEKFDVYSSAHSAVKTSAAAWNSGIVDSHSAATMHSQLDTYNNTGDINGVMFALSADDPADLAIINMFP